MHNNYIKDSIIERKKNERETKRKNLFLDVEAMQSRNLTIVNAQVNLVLILFLCETLRCIIFIS